MQVKLFLRKTAATVLAVAMLISAFAVSADMFTAKASGAADGQYYLYIDVKMSDDAITNALYYIVKYKPNNGTGAEVTMKSSVDNQDLKGEYTKGLWIDGWPTAVTFHYNCSMVNHKLAYDAIAYVNSTGESSGVPVAHIDGAVSESGSSNVVSEDAFTMYTGIEPYASNITFTSSDASLQLDGVSSKSLSLQTSAVDQYGVTYSNENFDSMTISKCSYNPEAISLSTTSETSAVLTASADAHIAASGVNTQDVIVTSKWKSSAKETSKDISLKIEDEKYTPSFKFYKTNTDSINYPTLVTVPGTATYYGDVPAVPDAAIGTDSYYTLSYHYLNGAYNMKPVTNSDSYVMSYTKGEHSFTSYPTTPASCTSAGVNTLTCTCGYSKTESVAAYGHSYTTTVVKPTCTEKGYTKHTCSRCGNTYNDNYITALGHDYVTTVVQPTCTAKGYTLHTCSRGDSSYADTYVDALEHNYTSQITKEPTCTEDGTIKYVCSRCGNSYTETIKATGHKYTSVVTAATCEKGGYTTHTCSVCKDTYVDDYTTALGHDKVLYNTAPIDQTSGSLYCRCSRCNKYYAVTANADGTYTAGTTEMSTASDAKRNSSAVPAPAFNMYTDPCGYKYTGRGAGLKIDDGTYTDANTTQSTRFAASVLLPEGVDYSFASTQGNVITDFGFVYSQVDLLSGNMGNLVIGTQNVYKMSVRDKNTGTFNGSNWGGVTAHSTDAGTVFTFNLVIGIKAMNWNTDYCARAYITYNYSGFPFTVYDYSYSARNVASIAKKIVASTTETEASKAYFQTKVIDNL